MSRRRVIVASLVAVGLVVGAGAAYAKLVVQAHPADVAVDAPGSVETEKVTRQTLRETAKVTGTLGYGAATPLPIDAHGIVTSAPKVGTVLTPGAEALRVDDRPVFLALGTVPLFRELRLVGDEERDAAGDKLGRMKGPDVLALQRFLVSKGFDEDGALTAVGTFGKVTEAAVKAWQKSVGLPRTGRVDRAQLAFVGGPTRVEKSPAVGAPFDALTVTSVAQLVSCGVTDAKHGFFPVGATVSLAGGDVSATGKVTKATRSIGQDGAPSYQVEVQVTKGKIPPAAGSISVAASRVVVKDALVVPARALLALADGGWALEVVSGTKQTLTRVEIGEIVDGLVHVTGVAEGAEVVVPL